jgi:hypothetical protein
MLDTRRSENFEDGRFAAAGRERATPELTMGNAGMHDIDATSTSTPDMWT